MPAQSIDTLRDLAAASPTISIDELAPGYPVLSITRADSKASLALHGAHLISWQPTGNQPVLYTSPEAIYREGKAIRGGIPICWPWFNAHPLDETKPSHGFARNRFWELTEVREEAEATRIELAFAQVAETQDLFAHQYELSYTVRIGTALRVSLRARNHGDQSMVVGGALHTYLAVGDLAECAITGLDGVDYLDCVGTRVVRRQEGAIHFGGEVDRIYQAAPPVRLLDRSWNRNLLIESEGSRSTVVWNPFFAKAAALGDLPDDAYRDFACIETANAGDDLVALEPGHSHSLEAQIAVA